MLKKFLVISLMLASVVAAGCGGNDAKKTSAIKVGATAGPHAQVVEAAAKEAGKKFIADKYKGTIEPAF